MIISSHQRASAQPPAPGGEGEGAAVVEKQAQKVEKQMNRIGALGQDGKKWKLSYDGPQQVAPSLHHRCTVARAV